MIDVRKRIIRFLIDNADSSIVLRLKKEILNNLPKNEENNLLQNIITQKNVQAVIQSQKPDGWFGNGFHGQSPKLGVGMYNNMEVGLRYLAEKGFPPENEYMSKAINSFLLKEPFDNAYGRKSPIPPATDYTYTASGLYLARSSIIIRAGYEYKLPENDFIDIKHDIDFSLKTFVNTLNYTSIDDVIDSHRKKSCFNPNILWPCIYHLRMLAYSEGWRNEKNISLLADSINHILSFPHTDEMIYTYVKGQFVGPCFAFINAQIGILGVKETENISLDAMELFARCKILEKVPLLKNQYKYMLSLIDENLNFNIGANKFTNKDWSPYFGFALEEDWKNSTRKQCDLLFRVLLIMHYSDI